MHLQRHQIIVLLLAAALIPCIAGCEKEVSSPDVQSEPDTTDEIIDTENTTTTETKPETRRTPRIYYTPTEQTETETLTPEAAAEKQIVEAMCITLTGELTAPYPVAEKPGELTYYESEAVYLMHRAEMLSERCLGAISDEDDLIEKARPVWIETRGEAYVELFESDYVEVDGKKMKYERYYPPYSVEYYTDYDVWLISPNAPAGIREDGVKFATPAQPPYLMIRGEDGMILGASI